jgi:hypothetical protein
MPERQRMTTRLKTLFERLALFVLAGGITSYLWPDVVLWRLLEVR